MNETTKTCECGCGAPVKKQRFKHGHNKGAKGKKFNMKKQCKSCLLFRVQGVSLYPICSYCRALKKGLRVIEGGNQGHHGDGNAE